MAETQNRLDNNQKYINLKEWIFYLVAVFFYTNMTGMIGGYRNSYFVDILQMPSEHTSFFNAFTGVAGFALSFIYAMILDNKKIKNGKKFTPLGVGFAIPCGIVTILIFCIPNFIKQNPTVLLIYVIILALIQGFVFYFGNTVNMVAVVMSPNSREREQVLSFRGISSAVGNSAPMLVVLILGMVIKSVKGEEDLALNYLISAILCGIVGTVTMLLGMNVVKERITYSQEKRNPFEGIANIFKNKHARVVFISEFLKSFRNIATYMQPFIAAAMMGSSSKVLIFALPVGVGTMVGMLIINALLKKFNSRVLYIASGVYSIIANCIAFAVGYYKLKQTQSAAWVEIVFVVCLFLTGLQFGASNLLPSMFKADILDDLELNTGKRLDASIEFVMSIGTTISGAIASALAPLILYNANGLIHYQQGLTDGTMQTMQTKIALLFFYTIFHGIMMFIAGLPFLGYKLTGAERERVRSEVLKKRNESK